MKKPLQDTEPENMEMVKKKKVRDEPLPDDLYNDSYSKKDEGMMGC